MIMCISDTCLLGCVLQALENKKHYLEWSDYTRFLRHLDALRQALYAQRRALGEPQNHFTPIIVLVLQACCVCMLLTGSAPAMRIPFYR